MVVVSGATMPRPYTVLSCCMSLDGYLDGASGPRWVLSNDADLDRVDDLRADSDAILVGAGTIRRDDPRLLVRDDRRRAARRAKGLASSPMKVTLTRCADLSPSAAFFAEGDGTKLVYCHAGSLARARAQLNGVATVVPAPGGDGVEPSWLTEDLSARGVRRLLVEGGSAVLTQFLTAGLADELQLAVAPLFVGDSRAPRFVGDGAFPWHLGRRARLMESYPIGDVVLNRYALSRASPPELA